MKQTEDQPYCQHCGYLLVGLTDSSKCPECGKPMVEVLTRDRFPGAKGVRYQSKRKLFGLPLISIATGPSQGQRRGRPVGVIAIGDMPRGVIAIGAMPIGGIAVGGMSCGVVSFGGLSLGVVALGGLSIGVAALGGLAVGGWAAGGLALYVVKGWGNPAISLISLLF